MEYAKTRCSRCDRPMAEPAQVEMLASGPAKWCASCWASEAAIRSQVKTTGARVREASADFYGDPFED